MSKNKSLCITKYCRQPRQPGKRKCCRCIYKETKQRDPVRIAYKNHKGNAKRRGKAHDLTLEEFREFCAETPYMAGKGRSAHSLHIDRCDETKGYTKDNIRVLRNGDNVRKYLDYVYNQSGKPDGFNVQTVRPSRDDDLPF